VRKKKNQEKEVIKACRTFLNKMGRRCVWLEMRIKSTWDYLSVFQSVLQT